MGSVSHAHHNGSVGPDTLQAGLQELADICHQLYTSADLHEKQYLSANDCKHALQNTQQFVVMALTTVTDRVAGTMRGLETQIAALVDTTASSERSINVLTTRLHGCHTHLDQLEWQRLRQKKPSARLPKHAPIHADTWRAEAHTIVATPMEPELFDFSMFDSIGTSLGRVTTPRAGFTGGGMLSMAATAVGNSTLQPRHDSAEGTGTKARGVPPLPPPAPSASARLEDGMKPASTVPSPTANTRPPAPPPSPPPPSVLARLNEVTRTDSHAISSMNASSSPISPPPPPPPPMFVSGKDTKSVPPPPPPPPALLTRLEGAAKLSPNQPPPTPPPPPSVVLGLSSAQGTQESHMSVPASAPPPTQFKTEAGIVVSVPSTPHPPMSLPLTTPANPPEPQPGQSGSTLVPAAPSSLQLRHGPVSIASIAQAAAQAAARLQPAAVPPPPPPLAAGPMQKSALLKQSDLAPSLNSQTATSSTSPSAPPTPPVPPPPAALKPTPPPPPPSPPPPAQFEPTPAAQAGPSPSRPSTSLTPSAPSAPSAAGLKSSPSSLQSTPPTPPPLALAQLKPASLRQVVPLTPASPPQAIPAAPSSPKPPPPTPTPPTLKPVAPEPLLPRWSPHLVSAPSLAGPVLETKAVAPPPPPPPPPRAQLTPASSSTTPQPTPLLPAVAVKPAPVVAPAPHLAMQEAVTSQVPNALLPPPPSPPPLANTNIFASRGRPPPLPAAIQHGQGTLGLSLTPQQTSPRAPSVPLHSEPAPVTATAHAHQLPPPALLAPALANLRPTAPTPTSSLLQVMPQSPPAAPVQLKPTTSAPSPAPMPQTTVPTPTPPPPALAAMSSTMPQSQTSPAAPVQLKPTPRAGSPPTPTPPHALQASLPLPPQTVALATLRSTSLSPRPVSQHSQSVDAPVRLRPTPVTAPAPTPPVVAKLKPTVLQPTSTSPPQSPSAPLQPSSNTPAPAQLGAVGAQTPAPPSPRSTEMSSKFSSGAVSAPSIQLAASPAAMLAHAMQSRSQPDGVSLEQIRGVQLRPTTPKHKAMVESGDRSAVSAALRSWQSREASAVPMTPPATTVQTLRSKLLTEASTNNLTKSAQQPHNGIDGYKSTALTSDQLVTSEMKLDTTPQQHRVVPVERPTAHNVTVTQQQPPRPDAGLRPVGLQGNCAQHDAGQTAETESMPAWAKLKPTTSTLRDTQRAETQRQSHPTSLSHGPTPAVQQAAVAEFAAKQAQAVTSDQKLPSSPTAGFQLPQKGNQQAAAAQHSDSMPAWARLKPTGSPGRDVNKAEPIDEDEGESETAAMPAWAKLKQSSASQSSQEFVVKIQFGNQPVPTSPGKRDTSVAKQSTHVDAGDEHNRTSSPVGPAGRVTASAAQQALAGLLNAPQSKYSSIVDRQDRVVRDSHELSPVHSRPEAGPSVKTTLASEGNSLVRSQMSAAAKSVQQALAALQSTTTTSATAPGWSQHASGAKSPPLPPPAPRSPAASLASKLAESAGGINKQQQSRPPPPPPPPMPRPASS